jgi:DNA polymerase I
LRYEGWLLKLERLDEGFNLIFIGKYGGLKMLPVTYFPRIYLSPANGFSIEELRRLMERQEIFKDVYLEQWLLPPWYEKEVSVVVASLWSIREYEDTINRILSLGVARIWNTMPRLEQRFLSEYGLPPSRYVEIDGEGSVSIQDDESGCIEPPFKRMFIRLVNWYGDNFRPNISLPENVVVEVRYGFRDFGEYYKIDSLDLSDLSNIITYFDPDIVECYSQRVLRWVSRDKEVESALKKRPRVYLDYSRSVMGPDEYPGIVELSRISYAPLDIVSRMTIGGILTGIEAMEAIKRRYLVPHINTALENWKTPHKLLMADRGGLYMNPMPGIFWGVAQCDFSSLYPSIMVKYNISPETVNNPYEKEGYLVAESGHLISFKRRGIIPISLSKLVEYRLRLKKKYRETGDKIYKLRYTGLKWILVASFGYLGYRNSRLGKIEAYECVTSLARAIMNKTVDIARNMKLKIRHVLVDSIWVDEGSEDDYQEFIKEVSGEIGIPIEIDCIYIWIVFLPNSSKEPLGVSNRYFGVTLDGSLKIKGIEAIRRDTPPFIAETQYKALKLLSLGNTPEALYKQCLEALKLYREAADKLIDGDVEPGKLVITRRVGRNWWEYRGKGPAIYAAKKIKAKEGDVIKYIVYNGEGYPVEKNFRGYDVKYYLDALARSRAPIDFIISRLEKEQSIISD